MKKKRDGEEEVRRTVACVQKLGEERSRRAGRRRASAEIPRAFAPTQAGASETERTTYPGLPAKYKDPLTGMLHATIEAFKEVRARYPRAPKPTPVAEPEPTPVAEPRASDAVR